MPRTNRQPYVFDLGSQLEEDEEDAFLPNKPIDDSLDKYIDQYIDNLPSYLDLPALDIPMGYNLSNEHNYIDFRALSEHQRVIYVVNAAHRARFLSLADVFIVQLCNFTCIEEDGLSVVCLAIYKPELRSV